MGRRLRSSLNSFRRACDMPAHHSRIHWPVLSAAASRRWCPPHCYKATAHHLAVSSYAAIALLITCLILFAVRERARDRSIELFRCDHAPAAMRCTPTTRRNSFGADSLQKIPDKRTERHEDVAMGDSAGAGIIGDRCGLDVHAQCRHRASDQRSGARTSVGTGQPGAGRRASDRHQLGDTASPSKRRRRKAAPMR